MKKKIGHVTILVKNYEAIDFYTNKAGFELLSDTAFRNGMRWVAVAPSKDSETAIAFVEAVRLKKQRGSAVKQLTMTMYS